MDFSNFIDVSHRYVALQHAVATAGSGNQTMVFLFSLLNHAISILQRKTSRHPEARTRQIDQTI